MVPRGTSFESGATACPFVALELDRDRRSERPDYRHRCYAETTPAPRTIAHQERFCLSPQFAACPIFQDWAVRAAARPVPLPQGSEPRRAAPDPRAPGSMGLGAAGAAGMMSAADAASSDELDSAPDEPWPDSMGAPLPAAGIEAANADDYDDSPQVRQLSAFEGSGVGEPADAVGPVGEAPNPGFGAYIPPPGTADEDAPAAGEAAPVPAFLVGRATRPRRSPKLDDQVSREDVVPSWEIDGRYGAQAGSGGGRDGVIGRLLTIVAVIVILGLGVAAVIIIPGLLSGPPGSTARPSFTALPASFASSAVPSGTSLLPTPTVGAVTPSPTSAVPTTPPTPEPSPIDYRIKSGDTLAKIARKHNVTVPDILAANPQITDPNHVEVGQWIVIPLPTVTPAP